MSYMNIQPNDKVTCPYNPAHIMNYSRFYNHFVKCQKQHPNDKRKPCPYNFSELIAPEKLTQHLLECRFRQCYGPSIQEQFPVKPKINAPYNIKFGPDFDDPPQSDSNFQFDDDIDRIDSVSMILDNENTCRNMKEYNSFISAKVDNSSKAILPPVNKSRSIGRGRGAFIRNISDDTTTITKTLNKKDDEERPTFSWLCEANIRGDELKPLDEVTDHSDSGIASKADSVTKSQFMIDLRNELRNPASDHELRKKVGRGRGMFLCRQ